MVAIFPEWWSVATTADHCGHIPEYGISIAICDLVCENLSWMNYFKTNLLIAVAIQEKQPSQPTMIATPSTATNQMHRWPTLQHMLIPLFYQMYHVISLTSLNITRAPQTSTFTLQELEVIRLGYKCLH